MNTNGCIFASDVAGVNQVMVDFSGDTISSLSSKNSVSMSRKEFTVLERVVTFVPLI